MKVQAMVWTSITNPIPPTRVQFGYMDGEKAGSDLALDWEDLDFLPKKDQMEAWMMACRFCHGSSRLHSITFKL